MYSQLPTVNFDNSKLVHIALHTPLSQLLCATDQDTLLSRATSSLMAKLIPGAPEHNSTPGRYYSETIKVISMLTDSL